MSVKTFGQVSGNSSSDSSGDSVGSNVLTVAVVIGSVLLLLAAMAGPVAVQSQPVAQIAKPAVEQVAVAAHPGHVS